VYISGGVGRGEVRHREAVFGSSGRSIGGGGRCDDRVAGGGRYEGALGDLGAIVLRGVRDKGFCCRLVSSTIFFLLLDYCAVLDLVCGSLFGPAFCGHDLQGCHHTPTPHLFVAAPACRSFLHPL
jgi:hypothetical protein